MTPEESLSICRLAKALSPAQAMDAYTPDAWHMILEPYTFDDAKRALTELGGESEWIHVSHIKQRIDRYRRSRLDRFGTIEPPRELDDDHRASSRYIREIRERVATGELTREQHDAERRAAGEIGSREMPPALKEAFRRVE